MTTVEVFAPAKVNLTLHITGRRDDGYHLLDSLVAFASVGDRLTLRTGSALSLTVEGPEAAGVPGDGTNLVIRAAEAAGLRGGTLRLEKHLPSASGIGGGSADAAALLRAMGALSSDTALALGADVPMCLTAQTARVRGIGERIEARKLPQVAALLVNPRVAVATSAVFQGLDRRDNAPMSEPPAFSGVGDLVRWLKGQRNDLQDSALALAPVIGDALSALEACDGCGLARMSGSGATCFGLFIEELDAWKAADRLRNLHPGWWLAPCWLGDQSEAARPR